MVDSRITNRISKYFDVNRYFNFINRKIQNRVYYYKNLDKIPLSQATYFRLKRFNEREKNLQNARFFNKEIEFASPFWFLHGIDEIFVEQVYKFQSNKKDPVILDCGANIGLSAIYFKHLYPKSKIVAFEPDPIVFQSLKKNLDGFKFEDVELINAAIWKEDTELSFKSEGSVGGKIGLDKDESVTDIKVSAVRLKKYLRQEVDFLKIDIEGAEYEVLKDCVEEFANVNNLFIEYHVLPNEDQKLHEILSWISKAGFKYYIREAWNNMSFPYLKLHNYYYQMQLNIFCYR